MVNKYFVVKRKNGKNKWAVKKARAGRASKTFKTQGKAKKWAKRKARKNKPSQVLVQGRDYKFRSESSYGANSPAPG